MIQLELRSEHVLQLLRQPYPRRREILPELWETHCTIAAAIGRGAHAGYSSSRYGV
jgi:hypothetical protein